MGAPELRTPSEYRPRPTADQWTSKAKAPGLSIRKRTSHEYSRLKRLGGDFQVYFGQSYMTCAGVSKRVPQLQVDGSAGKKRDLKLPIGAWPVMARTNRAVRGCEC